MDPIFFAESSEFRAWLAEHHATDKEILVGFFRKASGKPSITWAQSVDEALCFGWIDGVRRSIDEQSYCIRFTPRTASSTWSAVNVRRAQELTKLGRMAPAGLAAFERHSPDRTAIYSYEQTDSYVLEPEQEKLFRANPVAWEFFEKQTATYRKAAIWWVVGAKKEETRNRRLATLIDDSANGRTVAPLTYRP